MSSSTLEPFMITNSNNNVVRKKTIKKIIYMNPYKILAMKFCSNPHEIYGYPCPSKNTLLHLNKFWKDSRRQDGRVATCNACGKNNNKNRNYIREFKAAILADMKYCKLCLELLPLDDFTIKADGLKERASRCRKCIKKGLKTKSDAMSLEEKEIKKKIRKDKAIETRLDMKENRPEEYAKLRQKENIRTKRYFHDPKNRSKIKAARKRRYWETPVEKDGVEYENGKERDKIYRQEYLTDPEKGEERISNSRKNSSRWKKENRDRADASGMRRRAKKAGNEVPNTWEPVDRNEIQEIINLRIKLNKEAGCQRPNERHPEGRCWGCCAAYNIDHIWSIDQGGPDHQDNLRVTYATENKSKWIYFDEERGNILYDFHRKGFYTITKEGKKTFIKEEIPPAPRIPLVSFIKRESTPLSESKL